MMPRPGSRNPSSMRISQMQKTLTGQSEIKPRWKRCVSSTDNALGEALGQRYVELTFGADGKRRMLKMVDALEASLDQDIRSSALDDRRNQKAGQSKAGGHSQQDRLSRRLARLQFAQDRAW